MSERESVCVSLDKRGKDDAKNKVKSHECVQVSGQGRPVRITIKISDLLSAGSVE